MKLKNYIFTTLLLAIGLIMHHITPGILGGMKFDFLLMFAFTSLLLNNKFENAILTGILGGLLSAMTTTFPMGQIPNILDKIISCLVIFVLIKYLVKSGPNFFIIGLLGGIGTFISGMIFLTTALLIAGLPAPMSALIVGIVVPTTILNSIGTVFIYKMVHTAIRRSGIIIN